MGVSIYACLSWLWFVSRILAVIMVILVFLLVGGVTALLCSTRCVSAPADVALIIVTIPLVILAACGTPGTTFSAALDTFLDHV